MKYLKKYQIFFENLEDNIEEPDYSQAPEKFQPTMIKPNSQEEFEEMFEKYIISRGGIDNNLNIPESRLGSWIRDCMNGVGESNLKIREGGGASIVGLAIGSVLSAGKLLELLGQLFRHFVNFLKWIGVISGDNWKTTKFEVWGDYYTNCLKSWLFRPLANIFCQSAQPFLHMLESFAKSASKDYSGNLSNHCDKENIDFFTEAFFYSSLIIILGFSAGTVGHALGSILIGKASILGSLKVALTGCKIWEIKHFILGFKLKNLYPDFQKYEVQEIAHSLMECQEEYGISSSVYFDFKDKFQTTKVYNCLMSHLEHH